MDSSNNPNSQAPYFSLLNFPYDSFSGNLNFGSSQNLNPPQSQAPTQSQATHESQDTPLERRERRQWSSADDLVLISGWLNTSKDVIVGNDQRSGTFWQRITDYYASSDHVLNGAEGRTLDNCKQRWGRISREVSHFCGAYASALAEKSSGMNDVDIMNNALQLYNKLYKKKFTLNYAWSVLKNEQKWCSLALMNPTSNTSSKKRKDLDAAPSVGSVVGEEERRPPGIKAMKAKRYKGKDKVAQSAEYPDIWENKQKDNEAKKELQKMSILDSLIAKTQPLDEDEKALKKKLMAELF